jgi:hypothetical protein
MLMLWQALFCDAVIAKSSIIYHSAFGHHCSLILVTEWPSQYSMTRRIRQNYFPFLFCIVLYFSTISPRCLCLCCFAQEMESIRSFHDHWKNHAFMFGEHGHWQQKHQSGSRSFKPSVHTQPNAYDYIVQLKLSVNILDAQTRHNPLLFDLSTRISPIIYLSTTSCGQQQEQSIRILYTVELIEAFQ